MRATCPYTGFGDGPSLGFGLFSVSGDGQRLLVARGNHAVSPTISNLLLTSTSLETVNLQGGQIRKVTP